MVEEAQALQRPFSDVAVNIVAYNDDDPQKSESLDLYKIFPTSVTYLVISGTGTSLKKGGDFHILNYDKANQTADLIIEIPVEIRYDYRDGKYITGQFVMALSRLGQLEIGDVDSPLGVITYGPKASVILPDGTKIDDVYASALTVYPTNPWSDQIDSLIP